MSKTLITSKNISSTLNYQPVIDSNTVLLVKNKKPLQTGIKFLLVGKKLSEYTLEKDKESVRKNINAVEEAPINNNQYIRKNGKWISLEILANKDWVSENFASKLQLDSIQLEEISSLLYKLKVDGIYKGTINIPKDLFLKEVTYDKVTHILNFSFVTSAGNKEVPIQLDDLVGVFTNGNGISLENKQFSILINPNSEQYLKVDSNGLAIFGIDAKLNEKVDVTTYNEDKKSFITSIPDNYVTEQELISKGYLTEELDPTVPNWAKQPNKPTYNANEVGAISKGGLKTINKQSLEGEGDITIEGYKLNVELSLGESEQAVMSLKAITDKFNTVDNNIEILMAKAFPLALSVWGGGLYKKGTTHTINVLWSVKEGSTTVIPDTLMVDGVSTDTSVKSKSFTGITTNRTFTVKITKKGLSKSGSTSAKFVNPSYFGVVSETFLDTQVLELEETNLKDYKSYTAEGLTLVNLKVCYAYPASFSNLSHIKDDNNFEYINSYTKTLKNYNGELYNIYILTDATTIENFKQTYS